MAETLNSAGGQGKQKKCLIGINAIYASRLARRDVADPAGSCSYRDVDYRGPLAIVVGSERRGLAREWLAVADSIAAIPMLGISDSVNAAVAAFTKCLADRGKEDGVHVNCIHPSLVETERQWHRIRAEVARSGLSEQKVREAFCDEYGIIRFGKVEDVADLVSFIVSSRATWLHGATIDLDGGEIPVL